MYVPALSSPGANRHSVIRTLSLSSKMVDVASMFGFITPRSLDKVTTNIWDGVSQTIS